MSAVRILIVAPWGERAGGAEEMLWTILSRLDRAQIEAEVGFLSPGPFVDEVAACGIASWSLPPTRLRNPVGYVRTVVALTRQLRRGRPDVVLAWSAKAHLYLGVAALFAARRVRALWWQHAIASGHWLERLATAVPAGAVGCSSHACEVAQQRLRPRRKTFVVYPGVEPNEPSRELKRAELGIAEDAFVIGIVGRLQPSKGQHQVIRAVAELAQADVPASALLVGGSAFGLSLDYAEELERLTRQLGVEDRVVMTGQVDNAGPYYGLMDVFVNATAGESFGIVIVEAMLAGRAVVAFADGGPAEIVEDGETGLLISNGALAPALSKLAANPALRERLGQKGRERAAASFGAEASAAAFTRALVNQGGRS